MNPNFFKASMKSLTKRQHEILQYIRDYLQTHQYAPSFREIMQHFSFKSLGTVHRYIKILKNRGMLDGKKNCSRSLTLLQESSAKKKSLISVPFMGYISAGEPITTFSKSISMDIPQFLVLMPEATYALKVRGEGFIEEHIMDNDYLLIEARQEAQAGEMVVVLTHQKEVIVKKYFQEGSFARLVSHTPHSPPIIINEEDIRIQGIVIGVIRGKGLD